MAGESLRVALVANAIIAVIKFAAGILTGSSALISEGWHSVADTLNQVLLVFGIARSKRVPTSKYSFGYAKAQFFWSFVVAVLIFGVSGTLALREGISIILDPSHHELNYDLFYINIIILVAALLIEGFALFTAIREAKRFAAERGDLQASWFRSLHKLQNPVLLTVLTEDFLAVCGLLIALVGVSLTRVFKSPILDGYTSLAIGILLLIGGFVLAIESRTYLIGRSVDTNTHRKIEEIVLSHSHVKEIYDSKTLLFSAEKFLLVMEIGLNSPLVDDNGQEIEEEDYVDQIEEEIIAQIPQLSKKWIFIELS